MFQKSQISQILKQENHGTTSSVSVISNSEQHNVNHYSDIQVDVGRVVSQCGIEGSGTITSTSTVAPILKF